LYTEKLIYELKETMIMTGCASLGDITFDKVRIIK
jgi:isopentenyl diphosphate isomerase/L-lactate dehydrogenase-like FMN-dependent dehydrogenase